MFACLKKKGVGYLVGFLLSLNDLLTFVLILNMKIAREDCAHSEYDKIYKSIEDLHR